MKKRNCDARRSTLAQRALRVVTSVESRASSVAVKVLAVRIPLAPIRFVLSTTESKMKKMILLAAALSITGVAACGPRQVEVTTGAQPAADISIRFTNNLTQAVNLYVTSGGTDVFLKQVGANAVEVVPVRGLSAGQTVTLKARTVDGTRTYSRDNVTLASNYEWRVP
jgi:hypothetical protein